MEFELRLTKYGGDFRCQHCGDYLWVFWKTPRQSPVNGEHRGKCPSCNHSIKFLCNIVEVVYSA